VPPEIVASRLRRNVDLAGFALSMRNARLLVFLEPNIVTTRKPLSAWERTLRTIETTAPVGGRQEYYPRCLAAIEALFRGREFRSNVTYTDLTGIFDAFTAERSVFADGFHFGDRGNSILADAIGNALSAVNREASRTARR
jgi:hypothetical protein